MHKYNIFIMLLLLISFSVISIYSQPLIDEYNPNDIPVLITPGQGGGVTDADGDWTAFTSLPAGTSTSGAANAYLNGKIYHFGGSPGPSANYLSWDEATNVWTALGTMPGGARYYLQAETVAGKIYLIGGSTAWPTPTGMVEIFDGTNWSTGTSMPIAIHDAAYAVYQDRYIYVIGGMVGGWTDYRDHVQIYDTQTDTWAVGTNFPAMKGCMAGGCVGNIICVAGAYDNTYSNAIYKGEINASDPTMITWTTATATLRDLVYRPGGGVAGDMYSTNMVFFVGGQSPYSNQACGYDPVTDTYIQYPNKPTPLGNIGNFVSGNNMMYVMGGYDGSYNLTCEGMEYTMIPVPVELASFTAEVFEGSVELTWITATETNNQGFEVQRKSESEFETLAFINGNGTTTETHVYSYTDRNVKAGTYSYRLKQVDFDGTFEYSNVIEADVQSPAIFSLEQNYPNPFNPSTTINFRLAADSKVNLKIFNVLGQEVATLLNNNFVAGSHTVNFNASGLNSGVYMYRIEATGIDGTNFTSVKKMILTK
jgi:hypothetical protein